MRVGQWRRAMLITCFDKSSHFFSRFAPPAFHVLQCKYPQESIFFAFAYGLDRLVDQVAEVKVRFRFYRIEDIFGALCSMAIDVFDCADVTVGPRENWGRKRFPECLKMEKEFAFRKY